MNANFTAQFKRLDEKMSAVDRKLKKEGRGLDVE
jgi:hypothetical protein